MRKWIVKCKILKYFMYTIWDTTSSKENLKKEVGSVSSAFSKEGYKQNSELWMLLLRLRHLDHPLLKCKLEEDYMYSKGQSTQLWLWQSQCKVLLLL